MTELRIERQLPAQPERVWRALTEPDALAAWFWPGRLRPVATVEPRPGGVFRIAATTAALAVHGVYTVVEPPHRLEFTWQWDGDDHESRVTIELHLSGTGTHLVLTHSGLIDETDRDNHAIGWTDCLNRLPEFLDEDVDNGPTDEPDGEPPVRRRRDPDHDERPQRPRLLGGGEDIAEAMHPRPERLGRSGP